MSTRIFRPSRKRNAVRWILGLLVLAFGVGGIGWGAWPLGVVVLAIGLWILTMAALIAFRPPAYELHLDEQGFRVHDLFGRVAHDVRWEDVAGMTFVGLNAYSYVVVGWVLNQRRPKSGFWRWKRGGKEDDGCMPDTYGVKQDDLMNLMWRYWEAGSSASTTAPHTLEPF